MEFYLMTTSQVSVWSSSTWVYLVKLSQVKLLAMLILRIKAEVNGNSLTVEFRLMIALWYKYWVLFNHLSACSNCISSMEFVLMTASLISVWSSSTWVYLVKLSQVKFLAMVILRIRGRSMKIALMLNSGWWLHLSINTECFSTTWVLVVTASQVWNSCWWLHH